MDNSATDNRADTLMLTAVARECPDCSDERIFVPVDDCGQEACEFCCTACGAALLIDPAFDHSPARVQPRVA